MNYNTKSCGMSPLRRRVPKPGPMGAMKPIKDREDLLAAFAKAGARVTVKKA